MADVRNDSTAPFPRVPLGVAWVVAALVVGALGWLLFALSEDASARAGGGVLGAVALLGGATAAVLLGGRPARRLALAASGAFVLAGVLVAAAELLGADPFGRDALLLGGVPVLVGVLTALPALRR